MKGEDVIGSTTAGIGIPKLIVEFIQVIGGIGVSAAQATENDLIAAIEVLDLVIGCDQQIDIGGRRQTTLGVVGFIPHLPSADAIIKITDQQVRHLREFGDI